MLNLQEIGERRAADRRTRPGGVRLDRRLDGQHKGKISGCAPGRDVLGTAADCDIVLTDKRSPASRHPPL